MTASDRPPGCCRGTPAGRCGVEPARLFAAGLLCKDHTPAALAGQPELPPGPGLPGRRQEQQQ